MLQAEERASAKKKQFAQGPASPHPQPPKKKILRDRSTF